MKTSRLPFAMLLIALLWIALSGCSSHSSGTSKDDEMNSAMSAQQKAVIAEHKRKAGN